MTYFKGAEGRVKKGVGGKGKNPPPEIKALRETWNSVIEVSESSKPRTGTGKVLLNPGHVNTLFSPLTLLSKNLKAVESRDMTLTLFLISEQVERRGHENTG